MKSLTLVFTMLLSVPSFGFEVICTCDEPCKQVVFDIDESDSATLMAVDTETNQTQGPAVVSVSKLKDQTVYKLGRIVLVKEGNDFRMLGSERVCSKLVLPR